jgi:hypothetical protein
LKNRSQAPDYDSGTLRRKLLQWVLLPRVILLLLNIALMYRLGHDSADRRHDRFLSDTGKLLLDQLRTEQGEVVFRIRSGALQILTCRSRPAG